MALEDARTSSRSANALSLPASTLAPAHSLQEAVASTPQCLLLAREFFVSWHGVITLAYSGFPPALVGLKAQLAAGHPELPPENPGSLWPKTSLGCLREGAALTREQLAVLQRICADESAASFGCVDALAAAAPGEQQQWQQQQQQQLGGGLPSLVVDRLGLYVYSCRSLERLFSVQLLPLAGRLDPSLPSAEEQQRVSSILAEPAQPGYLELVAKPGSREGHYRGDRLGVTLAHPLLLDDDEADARQRLAAAIAHFRARVDAELPGLYAWFDDASLHVTLRAVIS